MRETPFCKVKTRESTVTFKPCRCHGEARSHARVYASQPDKQVLAVASFDSLDAF